MVTRPQTSKEYFKTLQIIYYALITGQVIFGLVTLYLRKMIGLDTGLQDLTDIFLYLVPVFIIGGYFLSRILFKSNLNTAINKSSLIEKMSDYRAALVIRYALLEGPSLFSIVIYLLTGNLIYLGMAGLIILVFFTMKPTKERSVIDLQLNPAEEQSILDPDRVIAEITSDNNN